MGINWLYMVVIFMLEAMAARRDARLQLALAQVEMAKARLSGNRVILTPEERQRLLRLGSQLNHDVHDAMRLVSVKTYKRWLREQQRGREPGRVGRPRRIAASLRELILRLARENVGWGVRRILGELRKLALTPSRTTVRRVLVDEGLLPDPNRCAPKGVTTQWRTFVNMHVNTMVATDFFCKTIWTPLGKRVAYGLMFIHLGSRKVFVSPSTYHPTEDWVKQQARNVGMWLEEEQLPHCFLIHDRDTKFTESFDQIFKAADVQIVKTPFQSPIANCYAESWIGTLKRECLNHFVCVSLKHLDHIAQTYGSYYNRFRPHQSLGNVPLGQAGQPPPEPDVEGRIGLIRRHKLLGGLLNHYERKAA